MSEQPAPARRGRWARVLLTVPFAALLFPTLYERADPRLAGIPFFIWSSPPLTGGTTTT
jgi:hypothetical protein